VTATFVPSKFCKDIQPKNYVDQVSWQGIQPGITSGQEVIELLHDPDNEEEIFTIENSKRIDSTDWTYQQTDPGHTVIIRITDGIVSRIVEQFGASGGPIIRDVLKSYGCPSASLSLYLTYPGSDALWSRVALLYPGYGMLLMREAGLVYYNNSIDSIIYLPPSTLDLYIKAATPEDRNFDGVGKIVPLESVVVFGE